MIWHYIFHIFRFWVPKMEVFLVLPSLLQDATRLIPTDRAVLGTATETPCSDKLRSLMAYDDMSVWVITLVARIREFFYRRISFLSWSSFSGSMASFDRSSATDTIKRPEVHGRNPVVPHRLLLGLFFTAILCPSFAQGMQITTQVELTAGIESHKELVLGADLHLVPSIDERTAIAIRDVANLTILGNGHTLDGGGRVRCLFIANSSVTMKDVRVIGCNAGSNLGPSLGHARAKSNLRLGSETVSAEQDLHGPYGGGGAIFASDSILNMTNCKISSNSATDSGGAGMYLTGAATAVTCYGCHFSNNHAAQGSDVYLASPDIAFTALGCPVGYYHSTSDSHPLEVHSGVSGGMRSPLLSSLVSYSCYPTLNAVREEESDEPMSRQLQATFQPADRAALVTAVDARCSDEASANSTYGDISTWDTSLVTSMSELFGRYRGFNCYSTFNGNITTWNTSSVTDMS